MNNTTQQQLRYVALPIGILLFLVSILFYYKLLGDREVAELSPATDLKKQIVIDNSNYKEIQALSAGSDNPKPIQELFLKNVKAGDKGNFTKSAAYWLSHRYFDNGGDIYEIYNYVQANPELSFLNEAESLATTSFAMIKGENRLPDYSGASTYIYLAYLEVLYKYGYLELPGLSTLINKYAEMSYYMSLRSDDNSKKISNELLAKSLKYHSVATSSLEKVMQGDVSAFAIPNDAVVGVTQYASALQFYKALKASPKDKYTAEEVFSKSAELAKTTTLNYFVNYVHAVSTIVAGDVAADKVKQPLSVIVNSSISNPEVGTVLHRIISSKDAGESGTYSFANTVKLANVSPEFKAWLMKNGWVEQNFYTGKTETKMK